jgi:hypothetical protein
MAPMHRKKDSRAKRLTVSFVLFHNSLTDSIFNLMLVSLSLDRRYMSFTVSGHFSFRAITPSSAAGAAGKAVMLMAFTELDHPISLVGCMNLLCRPFLRGF